MAKVHHQRPYFQYVAIGGVYVQDILGKYNVSDEDLAKVLEWKHT